ncbi:P-loop containing nucleoside triphosphate hydrolase protein [Xylaria venustula]|nr:P-loop containing nucleoside triphosphate hydrolase protein [Xylaria venustula]
MFKSLRSNPIEARQAFGDLPEAAPIMATKKGDQLQQILNGLPQGTDKRSISKDKKELDKATRSFGYGNCVARDGKWLIKGMKTPLHNHQVVGTSWMLRRELSGDGPTGGILADEMGLGKTLQTLACIVSNQPSEDDRKTYCPITLVVAPATAIEQWMEEVEKHADKSCIGWVMHYKQSLKIPIQALGSLGVILVSYSEMLRQLPNKKLLARLKEQYPKKAEFEEKKNEALGLLLKMNFWRVVLDESQNIKNYASQTSIACQNLKARYRWALSGTPITNSVDVLLLRLRQGAAHPFLLESTMKKILTVGDIKHMKRRLEDIKGVQPFFKRIGKWCAKAAMMVMDKRDHEDSDGAFGNSNFGYEFNLNTHLSLVLASMQEDVCRICYQAPVSPQIGQCKHVFCEECLMDHIKDENRNGRILTRCFECKGSLVDYEPLQPDGLESSDGEESVSNGTTSQIPIFGRRRLGLDYFKKHPRLEKSQSMFLRKCDQAHPEPVVPSAKTAAVKATILKWQSDAPNDKIIVFMEFIMTGAIIGRMLEAEGIPFLYFFGDMSQTAKQHAIRAFHERSDIKVFIASTRCGSVALNLTVANRVIIVDLWWNLAIEMQAFARVFRIGQTKETYFCRIVADATIDNRIEALQEDKEEKISKLMEPGGKKRLSMEETLSLFGRVKKSESGTFQVVSDDDGDDELDENEALEAAEEV